MWIIDNDQKCLKKVDPNIIIFFFPPERCDCNLDVFNTPLTSHMFKKETLKSEIKGNKYWFHPAQPRTVCLH